MDHQVLLFEKRELILDNINQLFHIQNLVSELYVNYDCDLYCVNIFEELCKALSKVSGEGLYKRDDITFAFGCLAKLGFEQPALEENLF